jgi:multicopper oxidase
MTTKRIRRVGSALALALVTGSGLLTQGSAGALPAGAPTIGMVCAPGTVSGSTHTFNLVAKTGYVQTPDGNSVFMWSYANGDAPDSGAFQYPGPVLCVTQGESVVVNLTNDLPEPTSIVFPGQDSAVTPTGGSPGLLTTEAPGGGSVSYSFTAGSPGTFLYQSGSDITKQVEMGLYGAIVVRPATHANWAYNSSTTQFDPAKEYLLLLAEIDPDLHHAVETGGVYDFTTLHNRYFTINGRSFPDTIQDNGTALLPTQPYGALVRLQPTNGNLQPALIRMINAGVDNHPFHPHGNHTSQIAQDGSLLLSPGGGTATTEHFGETIGAGQTEDYLLRWDDQDFWSPGNPLPVAQPNYRVLTFKDGDTYYGGNPYLGYKGTLPTGTVSQNICGEWYFPLHSHALNEFSNFDAGFGGMGTLLRVDPPGGCFAFATSSTIVGGALKSGSFAALGADDPNYYQVKPKTTTRPAATTIGQPTITVASASGFPTAASANPASAFYVRIDAEVLRVTNTAGTTWTVGRGQLGSAAATHASGAVVSALATDWYAGFTGLPAGARNLKVTYKGANCNTTTSATCTSFPSNIPQQTVKICNWTVAGAAGCATATSSGWVTLPAPPAQPRTVGSSDVSSTWTLPGLASAYIGTGQNKGQVRILVHTQRWTPTSPTPFSTWGNFMKLVYDAP